ncbi:MAG: hypothetical protein ACI84E_000352 [Planctomycetota bacterium]|jgi:hypothetical protein
MPAQAIKISAPQKRGEVIKLSGEILDIGTLLGKQRISIHSLGHKASLGNRICS